MTGMRDLAHSLDGSRLTSFRRCDFARDIPDVYSPSIWAGWYSGNYHEYEQSLLTQREKVKRLIHIEWGADSHAGRHSEDPEAALRKVATGKGTAEVGLAYLKTGGEARVSRDGDWSETYACRLFDWHLKTQEKLDWLTGSAMWIFKDFASPLRDDNDVPRINQKGVVEGDLTKKESYYVFQSYWAEKPMVHVYGHTWPIRWGKEGEHARCATCTPTAITPSFSSNGSRSAPSSATAKNFDRWTLLAGCAFTGGINRLHVGCTQNAAVVTDDVRTRPTRPNRGARRPSFASLKKDATETSLPLGLQLYDAKGVQLSGLPQHRCDFSLAGAGKLIDNLGTSRGSRELQLYNGRAEISVTRIGGCTVGIASDGLPAAFLKLS